MKNYTLRDLERQADKYTVSHRMRLKTRYKLAKELGFTAAEARILSFKSEETINQLAEEKNNGK